nr:unnamed protein product [Callosobruchus chinensis]
MDRTTRNATQQQQDQWTRSVSGQNAAMASEYFEQFVNASSLKHVLGYYRANLTSWRAKALWKKFDARAAHKCYSKGRAAPNTRVLIIGGGPCGLRTAIEAQLLGAKVVLVEKRDRFSRNNVLHLWPFVIEDLRMLGAKKFFGKFCAGAIDHISIRQLQCILLKVALLLGVEVHTEVGFERLIEPQADETDGKRNTLQGFTRKEFRGKLAIAITANFINKKTEAEARVEEISGVAFIFNQKFFKELHETTRIDLENIVYYKDDTHYFVMTAKKASLLEKGVIKQDLADTEKLLAPDNVDRDALEQYAIEAANFSTNYQLPDLEFAVNHYGQPDIAMFDFTSMYAAENASKVLERNGHKLLMILVGDSLLEPFWPTGSGVQEVFSHRWMQHGPFEDGVHPVVSKPESGCCYCQTNSCLYDTDDPTSLERMLKRNAAEKASTESASKKRRRGNVDNEVLLTWLSKQLKSHEDIQLTNFASILKDGNVLCAIIHHYRPDLLDYNTAKSEEPAVKNQLAFDILEKELGIPPVMTGQESISTEDYLTIATYLTEIYDTFRGEIPHIKHPKLPTIIGNDQKVCYENPYEITPECPEVPESLKDLKIEYQKESSPFKNSIEINKATYNGMQSQCEIMDSSFSNSCRNTSSYFRENSNRVSNWIKTNDFFEEKYGKKMAEGDGDAMTMVYTASRKTDVTKTSKIDPYNGIKVEERTDVVRCGNLERPVSTEDKFVETVKNLESTKPVRQLSKFSQYSPFASSIEKLTVSMPAQFSVIVETEEKESHQELPETTKMSAKLSDLNAKTIKTANIHPITSGQVSRPSSRHKRHAVMEPPPKQSSIDRKARKRKTLERVGASVEERQKILEELATNRAERQNKRRQQRKFQTAQFIKSMQMLQSNAKPDSQPFEDYAIFLYRQTAPKFEDRVKDLEKQFTYVPSHYDSKMASQTGRATGTDDDLVARIKSLEDKWRDPQPVEKKPKDLLRAIGKIETSDWNIKEIEKKIMENKMGKPSKAIDKEKVPKWSKEQFLARQTKMERQHYNRQESGEAKYADIDKSIQKLDQKLKEGTTRDLGTKKVASIRDNLVSKAPPAKEPKRPEKSPSRTQMMLPTQSASEFCHFCNKRVYLMERLSAEGRFFHHGCFKCQYCHTQLRLGSYAFDRDGLYGYKFYCVHHFGMEGELPRVTRKPSLRLNVQAAKSPPDKGTLPGIANVDLLDRVQTPERVEFSNLSTGNASSIHEDSLSQMDEDEWTDRNFGASCAELGDSDDETSSDSDSEMDDEDEEDAYDDALEDPEAKDGAAKWPDRWKHSYRRNSNDSDEYSSSDGSSYYENSSDDDESDTATEGEDEIRARELRRQEVQVEPPVVHTDTGTDTEIVSDESSSESSSEVQNSATEISTDSEFAQDDPTPTREILAIALNDFHVTKTRGSGNNGVPRKIQVTSGYIQRPGDGRGVPKKSDVELKLKPLVSPSKGVKPVLPLQGYALNRTQSTGGMAAKVSLELKKKYLLGDTGNSIQKSGSATALDSKFKSFQSNITDCQKLLKPAPEISNSMQTFCNIIAERKSPTYMTQHSSPSGLFPSLADSKQMKDGENEEKKMAAENTPSNINETEANVYGEETEHLKNVIVENTEINEEPKNENVPEGRPRSPLHETSIIVPQIDWGKKNNVNVSSDSLNSSSDEDKIKVKMFGEIPTVTVDQAKEESADQEEIPFDSLCHVTQRKKVVDESKDGNTEISGKQAKLETGEEKEKDEVEEELLDSLCITNDMESKLVYAEAVNKNVSSEKKSLNQPKTLPNLASALPEIHKSSHLKSSKKDKNSKDLEAEVTQKNSSGISSPESMLDQPTALTDTELSDWARDGIVSDDLEFEDILADSKDNHARNTQKKIGRTGEDEKEKTTADIRKKISPRLRKMIKLLR